MIWDVGVSLSQMGPMTFGKGRPSLGPGSSSVIGGGMGDPGGCDGFS